VLNSIDPELVQHGRFFRYLHSFLHGRGGGSPKITSADVEKEARLRTTSVFIAKARRRTIYLVRLLGARVYNSRERSAAIAKWAAEVGMPVLYAPSSEAGRATVVEDANNHALQQAILDSYSSIDMSEKNKESVSRVRQRLRRLRIVAWFEQQWLQIQSELQRRSEVFREGVRLPSCAAILSSPIDGVIRTSAVFALIVVAICAIPLAIGHVALMNLAAVFPLVHFTAECSLSEAGLDLAFLPCALSGTYSLIALLLS